MKRAIALVLGMAMTAFVPSAAFADAQQDAQETQIGQQEWQALQQKGEIITHSPYYGIINPIAARIKRVADPQYYHPFTFYLVHESQPNAFAVPGGNVYITDSLMTFVKNKQELAGVLCHETSHDIHHDVVHNMRKDQNVAIGATVLSVLFGNSAGGLANAALNVGASAMVAGFSRPVETAADLKGSETCAEAGYNPWGMVWLFQQFEKAGSGASMEMLSDHPTDAHRIEDLEAHFRQDPQLFAHYSSDISTGTALRSGETTATTPLQVSYR